MEEKVNYVQCPRCGKDRLHTVPLMNALSRRDNRTYICSPCGSHEAVLDVARSNPGLAMQMLEFMDDLDKDFKIMSEQQELASWILKAPETSGD
jgi:predicted RNA-binding Zn-ribbon protein involved in translation (DUF1610 family)